MNPDKSSGFGTFLKRAIRSSLKLDGFSAIYFSSSKKYKSLFGSIDFSSYISSNKFEWSTVETHLITNLTSGFSIVLESIIFPVEEDFGSRILYIIYFN